MISDQDFKDVVDTISKVIDAVGVLVIVAGMAIAAVTFLAAQRGATREPSYRVFRQQVGRAILLGLEFLVAADIIRTVAIDPTLSWRRGAGGPGRRSDVPELHARPRA